MGLFDRKRPTAPAGPVPLFTFSSPHNAIDTFEAVLTSIAQCDAYGTPGGDLALKDFPHTPPLQMQLYFSRIDKRQIQIRLGNRVTTYWTVTIDMTETGAGVEGTAVLDKPYYKISHDHYQGNYAGLYPHTLYMWVPYHLENQFGVSVTKSRDRYNG